MKATTPDNGSLSILRFADVPSTQLGGVLLATTSTSDALRAWGHRVSVLLSDDVGPRVPTKLRRFVVPVLILAEIVRRLRRGDLIDVVEIHEPSAAAVAWARRHLVRLRLPPLVVTSQGLEERMWEVTMSPEAQRRSPVPLSSRLSVPLTRLSQTRYAVRHADHVVLVSSDDRQFLIERHGMSPDRITCGQNGVDAWLFPEMSTPSDRLRVLFLGTWIERKGVADLAACWTMLQAHHDRLSLSLVGVMKPEDEVLGYFPPSARDNVSVQREFSREELAAVLREHDVFVLPTWFEGMPLSALEAAAAGLAVVATKVQGLKDVFRLPHPEADGAILVDPGDAAGMAEAIQRLLVDRQELSDLKAAARNRAQDFSWDHAAVKLLEAYRLAGNAPR